MSTLSASDSLPEPGRSAGAPIFSGLLRGPDGGLYALAKIVTDFLLAAVLLVLTAPLLGLAMALVKLTSRGPALYSQTRLGRHGRPFTLYKVRTMYEDVESLTGPRWCVPGDTRVTTVGRWLRRMHIDELPQLFNVLRGEMSLIGPRPERPEFVPRLERAIPRYAERLWVRPGLTGLAQVQLPPDTTLDSVRTKLAYDLHYVQHGGLLLDLRIAWATALKLIGVPFAALRVLFGLPSNSVIEAEYRAALVKQSPVKELPAPPRPAFEPTTENVP